VALLNDGLIVFLDRVEADRERTFDIALHLPGRWTDTPSGSAWDDPDAAGYMHIRDAVVSVVDGGALKAEAGDVVTAITVAANAPTTVITGTGVGDHLEDRVPMAILRRDAQATDFVWAVSLAGDAAAVEWDGPTLDVRDRGGAAWRLRLGDDGALALE